MTKTIMLTGATDGIGLETARLLASAGHTLILHGRSSEKLAAVKQQLSAISNAGTIETCCADLSNLTEVETLADGIKKQHSSLDVLINNAGVFNTPNPQNDQGHDVRFIVNTIAPYLLTRLLLPLMPESGRVINLSSAAQAPVDLQALHGKRPLSAGDAYAQSKLAITMWSFSLAQQMADTGPSFIAVNPASFLGSKMVKEAYGSEGKDLGIGADILLRAATSDEFENSSGTYYDNDRQQFSNPHPDALDADKNSALVAAIEEIIAHYINRES